MCTLRTHSHMQSMWLNLKSTSLEQTENLFYFIPSALKFGSLVAQYRFALKPDSVADAFLRTLGSNMSALIL